MRMLTRAILPVFGLCLLAANASADPSLDARLKEDAVSMNALQAHVADDNARLKTMQVAALFGESDEERQAREAHEQNQDQGIANVNQRVGDMENSLRSLTGQVEQLDHRIQELNSRIDRMQKDFDYKLCTMAAQQLGASSSGDDNALPCNANTGASQGPVNPAPQSFAQGSGLASGPPHRLAEDHPAPDHLAPGPSTLGTIPSNTPLPPPATGQGDMPAPAAVSHPEFDRAMNLLAKAQYDQALAAFQGYADKHPDDAMAPQALFWVGDIYYVQKDYVSALRALAIGLKKYPSSPRAPDSMLKLAESLIAMDRKKEGCVALAELPTKYPNATKAVVTKAAGERKAICTAKP